MLALVCLGTLALAAGLSVRWVVVRVDALGRVATFPSVQVGALLAAAGLCAVPLLRHDLLEHRLSAAASELVGSRVQVHCETLSEAWTRGTTELGWVNWGPDGVPEHRTILAGQVCRDLEAWRRSDHHRPTRDQLIAVHVLTHEAMHMAGQRSESVAECAAVQRDVRTASLLGAGTGDALTLARRYWREIYPDMPAGYTDGRCAPGGELDERLPGAPWG